MNSEKQNKFKDPVFNFGEAKYGDSIDFIFEWLGEHDYIEAIEHHCGCTDAYWENGAVRGVINTKTAVSAKAFEIKGKDEDGNEIITGRKDAVTVTKTVSVFVKDGRTIMAIDSKRRLVRQNPDKQKIVLHIMGTVKE